MGGFEEISPKSMFRTIYRMHCSVFLKNLNSNHHVPPSASGGRRPTVEAHLIMGFVDGHWWCSSGERRESVRGLREIRFKGNEKDKKKDLNRRTK